MKKFFAILAVAGLLTACNNDTESSEERATDAKEVPATVDTPARMMDQNQSNMPESIIDLKDTLGRRPHQ